MPIFEPINKTLILRFLSAGIVAALSINVSIAQSTYDLEPPLQSDTETNDILTSPDPNSIPTFAFVVASLNEDGRIEIKRSIAVQERLPQPAKLLTNVATQSFTVRVPYTELVDGKPVTKMRKETRTREVPVTQILPAGAAKKPVERKTGGLKPDPNSPVMKKVSVPYTVNIPYTEIVDGKKVNKVRQEQRMRTVSVLRGKTKTNAMVSTDSYAISEVKCYSVNGQPIDAAEINKRLQEKTPVILIKDPKAITPYFEVLLQPRTMFMVRPE